jgi:hypothetical protein
MRRTPPKETPAHIIQSLYVKRSVSLMSTNCLILEHEQVLRPERSISADIANAIISSVCRFKRHLLKNFARVACGLR